MSDELERLKDFLDELDELGTDRLVVRWTDETRPVAEEDSGYTVGRVARATLTARRGDEVVQESFEEVGYDELRKMVDLYPFQTLYRSDNVTR